MRAGGEKDADKRQPVGRGQHCPFRLFRGRCWSRAQMGTMKKPPAKPSRIRRTTASPKTGGPVQSKPALTVKPTAPKGPSHTRSCRRKGGRPHSCPPRCPPPGRRSEPDLRLRDVQHIDPVGEDVQEEERAEKVEIGVPAWPGAGNDPARCPGIGPRVRRKSSSEFPLRDCRRHPAIPRLQKNPRTARPMRMIPTRNGGRAGIRP